MNPELKTPLNLPPIPWDRILKWSAITAISFALIGLLVRGRTFLRIAQVVDIFIVVGLLVFAAIAIIARYASKSSSK